MENNVKQTTIGQTRTITELVVSTSVTISPAEVGNAGGDVIFQEGGGSGHVDCGLCHLDRGQWRTQKFADGQCWTQWWGQYCPLSGHLALHRHAAHSSATRHKTLLHSSAHLFRFSLEANFLGW